MFRKKTKTMSDRPEASSQETVNGTEETTNPHQEEFLHASEAASEHALRDGEPEPNEESEKLKGELAALNDKYLRLFAEFDNFRKRTARERLEMIQFAGENVLKNILPVLDDMERAIANNANVEDVEVVKQGIALIHHKLVQTLGAQGVKPMTDVLGQPLDVDRHEAITKAPAPRADLKGRVIEVVENGYTLNDKVIRFAKVVVGE